MSARTPRPSATASPGKCSSCRTPPPPSSTMPTWRGHTCRTLPPSSARPPVWPFSTIWTCATPFAVRPIASSPPISRPAGPLPPLPPPGALSPAHATAMGKVLLADLSEATVREVVARHPLVRFTETTVASLDDLLAQLPDVARQGYAVSDAEWEAGLRSIATPVRSRDGRVVAAVCAVSVRPDMTVATMEQAYLPAVGRASDAFSRALGFC